MIPFLKMHGLGNDFVVLNEFDPKAVPFVASMTPAVAAKLADRHFGVGCDQLLIVGASKRFAQAHARMDIWNTDGSRAEMCGNGIRAVALFLHDHGPQELRARTEYQIETDAGLLSVTIQNRQVRVNMGPPRFLATQLERLSTSVGEFDFWEVSMGNPHAVIFVPDLSKVDVARLGPVIENHPRFPKRTNVEFVQIISASQIQIAVWERGAGITLACGTGACASAVASIVSGATGHLLEVKLPGGSLQLEWSGKSVDPVWMTGPATEVFSGFWSG